MKKKLMGTLLAAAVMTSVFAPSAVGAFGGTYPASTGFGNMQEQEQGTQQGYSDTNPDNLFSVGGKSFILLDTDDEGNYFVMTEDLYGKHSYDTTFEKSPIISSRSTAGEFTEGPAKNVDDLKWVFNTEDEDNIGYWLNHGFLTDGNGTGNKLPNEIIANLLDSTWNIEGMKAVRGWTAKDNFDNKYGVTYALDFANSRIVEPYSVQGKLALMSITEYRQYQNLIGYKHGEDEWRGFMLRSPHAMINGDVNKVSYVWGGGMVKNRTNNTMVMVINDSPTANNMFVRPVMWLDKDFFKNVKIDAAKAGKIAAEEVQKNSFEDLLKIYSVDEIAQFYSHAKNAPEIKNEEIIGTALNGSVVYANYDFVPYNGAAEGESDIYWFKSDSADGEYSLTEVTGNKYLLNENGKFLKCCIIPRDVNGKAGKMYVTSTFSAVIDSKTIVISDIEKSGNTMSLKFKNPLAETQTARIITAVYDSDNQLVSVNSNSIDIEAGAEVPAELEIGTAAAGQRVAAMVWTNGNQPILLIAK